MFQLFEQFDLLAAFWMTIKLTALGALGSLVVGTICAIMRLSPVPALRLAGTSYVNIFRNTPLTLIIFATVSGATYNLGLAISDQASINAFWWAVIGLSVYHAAFVCEALRSGVNTIPLGQAEAARSIGLNFSQTLREVVLPQAFRGAITPLGNTAIALAKNTTVVVTIGVAEVAYAMSRVNEDAADKLSLMFLIAAGFFVLLTVPIGLGTGRLAQRLAVKR